MRTFKYFAATIAAILAASTLSAVSAEADSTVVDVTKPMVALLKSCKTDTELDCIQSAGIIDDSGTLIQATDLGTTGLGHQTDSNGNDVESGTENYTAGGHTFSLNVLLQSPAHVIVPGHTGSALTAAVIGLQKSDRLNVQMQIRTSWLKPEDIQLLADDATYKMTPLPGGTLWTLSGRQQVIGGYSGEWNAKSQAAANADFESARITFFVFHTGQDANHSFFEPRCASKGFPIRTFNAPAAGLPYWDAGAKTLNFGIQSPHANPQGVPYVGYFKLWVPTAYIDCMYPTNNVTNAAHIQVIVQDGTSQEQVADTIVKKENGLITVVANGFHYSSPTVKIMAVPATSSGKAGQPKASKLKAVLCVKGKLVKRFPAGTPHCPAGYKRKA